MNIHELLHVSGINGPSSGGAQLYNTRTIVRPYCHLQYVERSGSSSVYDL